MVVVFRAPKSYTREDVAEIHCHGGYLMVQRVLAVVLQCGARLAEPGEFTKRAFLNGRIDLLQAEAVIDLIQGKSEAALALATHQRQGLLSQRIEGAKAPLIEALALVEAWIDFPEEDVSAGNFSRITHLVKTAIADLYELLSGYALGRVLREGVSVVIAGKPNVGKSSLLNTLVQERRAIVTAVPGTTRDVIEEVISIQGLPVRMIDTAGIRPTEDHIEQEGVRRSLEKIELADLILFVLDGSRPFDAEDRAVAAQLPSARTLLVINKGDLPQALSLPPELTPFVGVTVSTLSGSGIDPLKRAIHNSFFHGTAIDRREFVALSQARHRDALERALYALRSASENIALSSDLEIIAFDLRSALGFLGEVVGETTPDDILDHIFSRFCIGK
jgi:tRNA modification GTPase